MLTTGLNTLELNAYHISAAVLRGWQLMTSGAAEVEKDREIVLGWLLT